MGNLERLKISDNKRYLVTESGKSFFWLADTDWTVPMRLKWDDALYLMDKRVQQGFTVLQMVALDPERDYGMHNPCCEPALYDYDLSKRSARIGHCLPDPLAIPTVMPAFGVQFRKKKSPGANVRGLRRWTVRAHGKCGCFGILWIPARLLMWFPVRK